MQSKMINMSIISVQGPVTGQTCAEVSSENEGKSP